jgi:hypothetical protein
MEKGMFYLHPGKIVLGRGGSDPAYPLDDNGCIPEVSLRESRFFLLSQL